MNTKVKPKKNKQSAENKRRRKTTTNQQLNTNFWKTNLFPIVILVVSPILLYFSSINFDYVLDDKIVLSENDFVKKGMSGIISIFTTDSFQGYFGEQRDLLVGGRYRPLSLVTFAIEYHFFGLNPKVSHFINILLYALSGLLMFRILFMLFPPFPKSKLFLSLPFIATLLFVLHPIHTEVVANIKSRDEIMALILAMSALYFSLKYIQQKNNLFLIGTGFFLLLGILAKENVLTWLAIIPLTIYFFRKTNIKSILPIFGTLIITTLIYFLIRKNALGFFITSGQESTDIMNNPFYGLPIDEKFATIFYTLGVYLKLLLYPHPLTHDYYPFQIPIFSFTSWQTWLATGANLALLVVGFWGLKRKHILGYGILFYFITLSIVSNLFVNIGTPMNERFIYMPSLGLCIVMSYMLVRWLPSKLNYNLQSQKLSGVNLFSVGMLMTLIIGYTAKSLNRIPDWKNTWTLNRSAVINSPNSARANCFMGVKLFGDYKTETDPTKKAALLSNATYFIDRSLSLFPAYEEALIMQAGTLAENYRQDRDLDKLLAGFTNILKYKNTTNYINTYIEHLIEKNTQPDKVFDFLYHIGHDIQLKERTNNLAALHYLKYAYQLSPSNQKVIRALVECYRNQGNETKANEFQRLVR